MYVTYTTIFVLNNYSPKTYTTIFVLNNYSPKIFVVDRLAEGRLWPSDDDDDEDDAADDDA